jgi:hypothetical protein
MKHRVLSLALGEWKHGHSAAKRHARGERIIRQVAGQWMHGTARASLAEWRHKICMQRTMLRAAGMMRRMRARVDSGLLSRALVGWRVNQLVGLVLSHQNEHASKNTTRGQLMMRRMAGRWKYQEASHAVCTWRNSTLVAKKAARAHQLMRRVIARLTHGALSMHVTEWKLRAAADRPLFASRVDHLPDLHGFPRRRAVAERIMRRVLGRWDRAAAVDACTRWNHNWLAEVRVKGEQAWRGGHPDEHIRFLQRQLRRREKQVSPVTVPPRVICFPGAF